MQVRILPASDTKASRSSTAERFCQTKIMKLLKTILILVFALFLCQTIEASKAYPVASKAFHFNKVAKRSAEKKTDFLTAKNQRINSFSFLQNSNCDFLGMRGFAVLKTNQNGYG